MTANAIRFSRGGFNFTAAVEQAARLPGIAEPGSVLLAGGRIEAAKQYYEAMLGADPASREAHAGLYYVYSALGNRHSAAGHLGMAMQWPAVLTLPYRGSVPATPVLLLLSMNAGNVLIQRFLDDRVFQTYVVIVEFYTAATVLPYHQLIVNGVGDADVRSEALRAAARVILRSRSVSGSVTRSMSGSVSEIVPGASVINSPARVLETGRCGNARRLDGIPGVHAARTAAFPREHLESAQAAGELARQGFEFPLLARAPGYHMGKNFVCVDAASELPEAIAALPGSELIVIEYLDGRGADGKFRKYRVLTIGGRLYPVHLAVSAQWKVHYFSADMEDCAEHRAEEAAFLADMEGALGPKAMAALARLQAALGLDYGGIDFGLNAGGEVLLYEANATMAVHRPGADLKWDYRRPPIERIYAAVQELFLSKAREAEHRRAG